MFVPFKDLEVVSSLGSMCVCVCTRALSHSVVSNYFGDYYKQKFYV